MSSPCHARGGCVGVRLGPYRRVGMTKLSTKPLIHPTANVRACRLGAYTEIGARTRLLEVAMGDYS